MMKASMDSVSPSDLRSWSSGHLSRTWRPGTSSERSGARTEIADAEVAVSTHFTRHPASSSGRRRALCVGICLGHFRGCLHVSLRQFFPELRNPWAGAVRGEETKMEQRFTVGDDGE